MKVEWIEKKEITRSITIIMAIELIDFSEPTHKHTPYTMTVLLFWAFIVNMYSTNRCTDYIYANIQKILVCQTDNKKEFLALLSCSQKQDLLNYSEQSIKI